MAGDAASGGTEDSAHGLRRLACAGVRSLKPYEPGKPEEELRRELGLNRIVKLASNENPLGPGALAIAAVRDSGGQSHRYPDGNGFALKQSLARKLNVDPAQITLGNGSDNLFELLARTFLTPEREAVYSQHGFAMYPIVTQTAGARAVEVPARDWGHDLEAMLGAVTARTAIVFIANPNNPTGTWVRASELEHFLAALSPTVVVVLDEAYCEYVAEPEYPDGIALGAKHPNVVVTRTFSKIHGLGGLRVGYGVCHPAVADLLNRARSPFNVSRPAQAGALAALEDQAHIEHSREVNRSGMTQLIEGFERLGLEHIPSLGNFVCVKVPGGGVKIFDALLRRGVIVRALSTYGMPDHLRVTIGTREENEVFLAALAAELGHV
ncbi:MAG: histidinol-phosphate transaminase [Gammaproteobacteria bacterium]